MTELKSAALAHLLVTLENRPASAFVSHDAPCCRIALGWFTAMARSAGRMFGRAPWSLTERWSWGPTHWPLSWCEAVRRPELDCGGLAQLAEIALQEAGNEVVRVQLLECASSEHAAHWAARWSAVPGSPRWIWGEFVYHEAVGVVAGAAMRIWDPTEGRWHESATSTNHGKIVAIRVLPTVTRQEFSAPPTLDWDSRMLPIGCWTLIS
jgi:hypothetical protein